MAVLFTGTRRLLELPPPGLLDLLVGAVVKFKINNVFTRFIIVHHGVPGSMYAASFENTTTLMAERLYESRAWGVAGNNSYEDSTIHPYLNGTFKNMIDEPVRTKLVQVRIPYRPSSGNSSTVRTGENGLLTQIFLPAMAELGHTIDSLMVADGQKFDYFISGESTEANNRRIALNASGTAEIYWSRSPYRASSPIHTSITVADGRSARNAANLEYGIRPVLVLPKQTLVSLTPDVDGAYELIP